MFPVETFRVTIGKCVAILERHSIRFHLTGGITTIAYGEPRMTQDIDFVVENEAVSSQLDQFIESLAKSDFMHDASAIQIAVASHGMFQLFDAVEALKLDIYAREAIPGELGRSQYAEIFEGLSLPIASRADAAASKLLWISKGSHKSRRDLRQIYRTSTPQQRDLIIELVEQLSLRELLREVLNESDEIE